MFVHGIVWANNSQSLIQALLGWLPWLPPSAKRKDLQQKNIHENCFPSTMEIGYIYINRIKTCLHHSTSTIIKVPICSNPRTNSSNLAVQQKRAPFEKGEGKPGPSALLNSSVEAHFHDDDHHHQQQHYHTLSYIILPPTPHSLGSLAGMDSKRKHIMRVFCPSLQATCEAKLLIDQGPVFTLELGEESYGDVGCICSKSSPTDTCKICKRWCGLQNPHLPDISGHQYPTKDDFHDFRWCVPSEIRTSTLNIPPQEPIGKKNAKNDGTVKYCKYAYVWRCLGGLSHPSISPRNVEKTRTNNIKQDEFSDNPTNIFLL